jgi:predicted O-linked N-acetylglucosamine transferase (SPINDLY family)
MLPQLRDLLKLKKTPRPAEPSPGSWEEQFQQATLLQQQGRLDQAIELFSTCIELAPERAEAYYKRANSLNTLERLEPALEDYNRAISLDTSYAYAFCNRGTVLQRLGRWDEALASYDRALELDPKDALTHYNRGSVLRKLGRHEEALTSYDAALKLNGNYVEALIYRGFLLQDLSRHEAAIDSFRSALALNAALPQVFEALGVSLHYVDRLQESLAAYDRAIALKPDLASPHLKRGLVLTALEEMDEAIASFDKAIEIDPNYAEAYYHRGYWQRLGSRFDLAAKDFAMVADLTPDLAYLPGTRLDSSMQVCDWSQYDTLVRQVTVGIENDERVAPPFVVMTLTDSVRLQQKAARTWVNHFCPADGSLGPIAPRARPQKLTIGYFSADLQEHPVARLISELIEIHDRSRFEVIAFSLGPESNHECRQRLVRAFDRFIDVRERSSAGIATLARKLNVDIAIDLGGHTIGNRVDIFALRAAPVQVSYLGLLGTTGASYMDYILADRTVVTPATESYYDEKIIYLPDTHQANDRQRRIADKIFTREELGLPANGFVFCCFNSSFKILPKTFASWMRILKAVPSSVLFIFANHPATETNLRAHAASHGVDSHRLVFGKRLPPEEYLARYRTADLFLDTQPYTAGTTASDALWAGLPLLTLTGESFSSRTAASMLAAIGAPELITSTQQQYEQLAIELASSPQRLATIRAKIQDNRLSSPLFDTPRFARNLEAAYTAIYDRYQSGLPPDHVSV